MGHSSGICLLDAAAAKAGWTLSRPLSGVPRRAAVPQRAVNFSKSMTGCSIISCININYTAVATPTNQAVGCHQVELSAPLKRGDGVVFDAGAPAEAEQGGAIYDVLTPDGRPLPGGHSLNPSNPAYGPGESAAARGTRLHPSEVLLMFGPGCVDGARVAPGSLVWRSSDPELEARLRATYEGLPAASARRLPVDVAVAGGLGQARQCPCLLLFYLCCGAPRVHDRCTKSL